MFEPSIHVILEVLMGGVVKEVERAHRRAGASDSRISSFDPVTLMEIGLRARSREGVLDSMDGH
jgi:hypothetical protein